MSKAENMVRVSEETTVWNLEVAREKLDEVQGLTENELQLVKVYPPDLLDIPSYSEVHHDIALWFGLGRDDNNGPACFAWFSAQRGEVQLGVRVAITNKYIFALGEKLDLPGPLHEQFEGAFDYLVKGEGSQETRKTLCEVLNGLQLFEWNLADRRV